MSDALTDMARDERRSRNYYSFLSSLADYLESKDGDQELFEQVVRTAKNTDAVKRGLWGGSTRISDGLVERVERLKQKDPKEWAVLLIEAYEHNYFSFERLKGISPFVGSLFTFIEIGSGYLRAKGELPKDLDKYQIRDEVYNKKGRSIYNHSLYAVIFPNGNQGKTEIIEIKASEE